MVTGLFGIRSRSATKRVERASPKSGPLSRWANSDRPREDCHRENGVMEGHCAFNTRNLSYHKSEHPFRLSISLSLSLPQPTRSICLLLFSQSATPGLAMRSFSAPLSCPSKVSNAAGREEATGTTVAELLASRNSRASMQGRRNTIISGSGGNSEYQEIIPVNKRWVGRWAP